MSVTPDSVRGMGLGRSPLILMWLYVSLPQLSGFSGRELLLPCNGDSFSLVSLAQEPPSPAFVSLPSIGHQQLSLPIRIYWEQGPSASHKLVCEFSGKLGTQLT